MSRYIYIFTDNVMQKYMGLIQNSKEYDISIISTPYFPQPSQHMGSVERVSFQRFKEMKIQGYNVNFIAPLSDDFNEHDGYNIDVIKPMEIPDRSNLLKSIKSSRGFDYFRPYLKIEEEKIGKIVLFDGWRLEPWDFLILELKLRKSKIINILHPPLVFIDRRPIKVLKFLYSRSIWGCLNTNIQKYFQKNGFKTLYLPNGVGIPDRSMVVKNPENFLIFFGRIEESKAPHLAIKLSMLLNIPLKIFGKIFDYNYFEEKIKPHVDCKNIFFYKEVSYTELFENVRNARASVYFSNSYDPAPIVLLESISFGVPVIGCSLNSLSGFHDVIHDGENGIIIAEEDLQKTDMKREILDKLEHLDRVKIYNKTELTWSWSNVIENYYKFALDGLL